MRKSARLIDLLQVQNGFAFASENFVAPDEGFPLIRIRDLGSSTTKVGYGGEYRDDFIVNPGDLLIGMDGDFECHRWTGPQALLNQRVCRLRNFSPRLNANYLFHWIGKALQEIHSQTSFVTVKHISSKQILNLEIPLPSIDEQRRIAMLLDRAVEIKRRTVDARANAAAIAPALFVETFGDPATNPKGWPVVTVGDLLESAAYGTSQKANDRGDGLPMIRMGNVTTDGKLDTADLKHIDLTGQERENADLREGDLLFNRTNSKELVGKTGLWDGRFEAVAASYFIRLRVKRELVSPSYFWAFLNTQFMKRSLFNTARGAIGQANINAKELRSFRVAAPPLELQTTFAEQLKRLEAVTRHLDENTARKAEAMVAGLSAEVFV